MKNRTQEERLDYLVEEFKADSGKYKDIETPFGREMGRLMNSRQLFQC